MRLESVLLKSSFSTRLLPSDDTGQQNNALHCRIIGRFSGFLSNSLSENRIIRNNKNNTLRPHPPTRLITHFRVIEHVGGWGRAYFSEPARAMSHAGLTQSTQSVGIPARF